MDTINSKIAELFENNREYFEGKPIAFDGVVDEESYKNSCVKTVFLLKEVNDPDMTKDWKDFMFFAKQQADVESMYKTWPNVCLWIEALKNPKVSFSDCVDEYGSFETKKLQKNILDIAIVNIKKTAGGGNSEYNEICLAAKKYGHVVREQIEKCIIPELVICGGTFDFAKMIFDVSSADIFTLPSGAQFFIKEDIIYLQFVHPMWFSVNRNILFAYAKTVFAEIRLLIDDIKTPFEPDEREKPITPGPALFFYVNDKLLFHECGHDEGEPYGNFINYPHSHFDIWNENYEKEYGVEFDYYPRGRVVYRKTDNTYLVYYDKCMEQFLELVTEKYAGNKIVTSYDEHYQCHRCNKHYVI